ncbi:hypothetical protein WMY93_025513 [Mugilogobius chulae]|uniref:Uncharacterized protein n=1 Tax=Mugilogobius chulae TaxID=88201 RepID=A0AAW0N1L0_9GOBI
MLAVHFLLLLSLQISAEEQNTFMIVSGANVTLPCGIVSEPENNCSGISWTKENKYLVRSGSVQPGDMFHRLNLTESCELHIPRPSLSCEVTDLNQNMVYFFSVIPDKGFQQNQTLIQTEAKPGESHGTVQLRSFQMNICVFDKS